MASCSSCRRPVAVARATCLYCGASLPPEDAAATPPGAPEPAAGPQASRPAEPERALVVLDVTGVVPETLARALPVTPYDAGLLVRRGGFHLHRALDPPAALVEAERIGALGIRAFVVPEAEARVRPLRCLGGHRSDGVLTLRTEEGPLTVRPGDVLLVVRGPVVREYLPSLRRRRVDTARLDEGYRVHLHRRTTTRPVEIDAANFEFGLAVTGSARLEVDSWVEVVAGGAPSDDGFRRLPPALGPAAPEPKGKLSAASSLGLSARGRGRGGDEGPVVLDNAEQFRFYSGWRAAVERRR
jgi:hypothetical protein